MSRRKKWSWLWVLIPVVAVVALFVLAINYLIDPALYRNLIQKSLTANLGREVTIGRARISLWGGVGVAFEDLRVRDRSLPFDLLQSKRLILKAKLLPLLRREVRWKRIVLDRPIIRLVKNKNGEFNLFEGQLSGETLKASEEKLLQALSTLFGGSLALRDGEISFTDESLGESPVVTQLRAFNLQLSEISHGTAFPFRLSGKMIQSRGESTLSIEGTARDIPEDLDFSKGSIDAEVKIEGLDIPHLWPYLKKSLPMKTFSGILDIHGRYQGEGTGVFKTSGKIRMRDVVYDHPQVFSYVHTPKWLNIDFDLDYDKKNFNVSRFSVELPDIAIKGKGRIYGIGTKEMGMEAEAQSGPFDVSDGRRYIPFGIIEKETSDHLFRSDGKGPVQIVSVRLSGKMPEIEHCDQLQYAHTLSVEMKLNKVRLKLPWEFPILEDIQGRLSYRAGDLQFKELDGRFFHSTIDRAGGVFYQLLQVSTLQVNGEGKMDVADLPPLAKMGIFSTEVAEILAPVTSLSGRADYRVSARGVLKSPLHFQHQGAYALSKVRFNHSRIPMPVSIEEGKVNFSNEEFRWSGTKVEFGNSSLILSGALKGDEPSGPVEITARGRVDLKNLFSLVQTPLFPEEIRSKARGLQSLSGTGQISFKGMKPAGRPSFSFEGELLPREVTLHPKGVSTPLTLKEGALSFSNLGIGFSKLRVQSGNSTLLVDGSIRQENLNLSTSGMIDLKQLHSFLQTTLIPEEVRAQVALFQRLSGETEVRLKWVGRATELIDSLREGELKLKGVSIQHEKIPVPLNEIEGSFFFSPGQFRLEELKGKLGESPLTVSGTILRPGSQTEGLSSLSLQVFSPQLDLDPLFPKTNGTSPDSFEELSRWLSKWDLDLKVTATQGSYSGFLFQDLKAEMKTIDGRLHIDPFQFRGAGGDFWSEGWIEPAEKGVRFEIKPRVSNMGAKAFLRAFLRKGREEKIDISGRVHISKVELRGEGEDFQKAKESLNGVLRLEFENGVIERFNLLSKVFSILNVSQLFKLRFPDLRTKGLPYRQITATIQVKEGVASTEDFLVDSDAMRITLLGKIDLGKNQIDARVGVHPLGTVDTVLSNVPIVGYILTGKEKAFLSVVYEVKGDLDDPKIDAVPLKSAGEGFLGIMKRILETPFRPFQKNQK